MAEELIKFNESGFTHLQYRFPAASIRERVERNFEKTEKFIFDFDGVESISNSFADECFAKLLLKFEMDKIKEKTTFQNTNPFIKSVVANAFKNRISAMVNE